MSNKFNLSNKLVIITGCTSGIGYETAIEFSKKNTKIALISKSIVKLENLKNELRNYTTNRIEIFDIDLSEITKVNHLIKNVESKFNQKTDILINCAGYATLGNIIEVPINSYSKNLDINFFVPLILSKSVIGNMKKNNSGQIIFINSASSKRGLPGSSSYCISKSALSIFVESLRVELYKYNIDVISVLPGLVDTNIRQNSEVFGKINFDFTQRKSISAKIVAKKIVEGSILRKNYIVISFKTYLSIIFSAIFPKLVDRILADKIK